MRKPLSTAAGVLLVLGCVAWMRAGDGSRTIVMSETDLKPSRTALRPGLRYELDMRAISGYWTAYLYDADAGRKVPVYRSMSMGEESSGHFIVPAAGTYELVLRTHSVNTRVDVDTEPSFCREVRAWKPKMYAHDLSLLDNWSVRPAFDAFCNISSSVDIHPVPLGPPTRITRTLSFADSYLGGVTSASYEQEIHALRDIVYADSTASAGGMPGLGYWTRLDEYGQEEPMRFGTNQHSCEMLYHGVPPQCWKSYPPYAWRTLGGDQLGDPEVIGACVAERQFAIFGDSLAGNLFLGIECHLSATPRMTSGAILCAAQVAELAMFTPLDVGAGITYEDFLVIAETCSSRAMRPLTDVVHQLGTWAVSHISSVDWARGLQRLARYSAQHARETGVRHWFATVPPVYVQDDVHTFTSPARVFKYNQILFAVAAQHNVPIIDSWAALDAREDGRIDRVHFCPQIEPEWASIALQSICTA